MTIEQKTNHAFARSLSNAGLEHIHEQRLRAFVREHLHGKCKVFSLGDDCKCPLCDLDRLCEELRSNV